MHFVGCLHKNTHTSLVLMIKLFRRIFLIIFLVLFAGCNEDEPKPIVPTSITIEPQSVTMTAGESLQLSVIIEPRDVTDKDLSWRSSNSSVVTVDSFGIVVAIKEGSAVITASCGGKSATCKVTVSNALVSVESVKIDKSSIVLIEGESEQLIATVSPYDATDKSVVWSTTNSSIAVVDEHGLVTAISSGTTDVIVVTKDGAKIATCNVTVQEKDTENGHKWVDLGLPSGLKWATCNVGANAPEEYGDYFAWGEIEPYYSSQNPVIWKSGKTSGYSWNSYRWCEGNETTLTKYNNSSLYGQVVDYKATLEPADDAARVNWQGKWRMPTQKEFYELINSDYCTTEWVSQNGVEGEKITSIKNGNSIFLPAAGAWGKTKNQYVGLDGVYWSSTLDTEEPLGAWGLQVFSRNVIGFSNYRYIGYSVRAVIGEGIKVAVTSVSLSKSSMTLMVGETAVLSATVKPDDATYKTVTWTSSHIGIATVDAGGNVTAVREGTATMTATAGGKSASCKVTVSKKDIAVTGVTLNKTSLELTEGNSEMLTATVKPDDATYKTVTWTSSDTSIATVDAGGKVTAVREGTATITATAGGKSASCKVTVSKKAVAVTGVTLNKTSLALAEGGSETLTATVKPDNATDKTVTWTTSDASIATVDGSGRVTAVKAGTATITAAAVKMTAVCQVSVKSKDVDNGSIEGTTEAVID